MDELKLLMQESIKSVNHDILKIIFNCTDFNITDDNTNNTNNIKSTKVDKYLGSKFRTDMNNLINELQICSCQYIRCLKPNEEKKKEYFISNFVMQQIRYLGILDTIRVRQEGYPVKKLYIEVYTRYEDVCDFEGKVNTFELNPEIHDVKNLTIKVVNDLCQGQGGVKDEDILFGKTVIFIKQEFFDKMDKIRAVIIREKEKYITRIAMNYRGVKYRKVVILLL
jgi:myosin heavy subunit